MYSIELSLFRGLLWLRGSVGRATGSCLVEKFVQPIIDFDLLNPEIHKYLASPFVFPLPFTQ